MVAWKECDGYYQNKRKEKEKWSDILKGDIIFIVIVSEYKQIYCERLGIITGPFRSFIRLTECRVGRKLIRQFFLLICLSVLLSVRLSVGLRHFTTNVAFPFPCLSSWDLWSIMGTLLAAFKRIFTFHKYTIYTHMGTCNTQGFNFEFIFWFA